MPEYIQFPTTAAPVTFIGADDKFTVVGFFGPVISGTQKRLSPANPLLREYIKGGAFVPNVAQNSGVPASGDLDMLDLLGAYAALDILSSTPANNTAYPPGGTPNEQTEVAYSLSLLPVGGNWGITDHAFKHAEFMWQHSLSFFDDLGTGANLSDASQASYSASQYGIDFRIRGQADGAGQYANTTLSGTVTLYVRSLIEPAKIVSSTTGVSLNIFGTA